MDMKEAEERSMDLVKDIYLVLKKHNLSYHEAFLALAATTAAIGNDDFMEEDHMLSILRSAIKADKYDKSMELQ